MQRPVRLKRWFVPASLLSLAVAAVGFIAVISLADDAAPGPAPPTRRVVAAAPPAARVVVTPARPSAAPAPARPVASPTGPRAAVRPTPRTPQAVPLVIRLARTPTLAQRLGVLEDAVARLNDEQAVALLGGLLDSQVPGDHYEAESLRLRALALLGGRGGARAEACLVERIRPEVPRPERLLALEMLAARDQAGDGEIQAIASVDHDRVVQAKARWALERRGTIR